MNGEQNDSQPKSIQLYDSEQNDTPQSDIE
jgi:hypothetical protein